MVMETSLRTTLCLDSTAVQTQYRQISLAVTDNTGDLFGVALRELHALQESERLLCGVQH